ncbi:MAG: hypothetical protein ABIH42_01755 [Planctomycetota bacterium]
MDENKQPGIEFLRVVLLELNYKWNNKFKPKNSPFGYDINAEFTPKLSVDNKNLDGRLTIKIKSEPLTLNLVLSGLFKEEPNPNLSLKEFLLLYKLPHY